MLLLQLDADRGVLLAVGAPSSGVGVDDVQTVRRARGAHGADLRRLIVWSADAGDPARAQRAAHSDP